MADPILRLEAGGEIVLVHFAPTEVTVDFVNKNCFQTFGRSEGTTVAVQLVLDQWIYASFASASSEKVRSVARVANFVAQTDEVYHTAYEARASVGSLVTIASALRSLHVRHPPLKSTASKDVLLDRVFTMM